MFEDIETVMMYAREECSVTYIYTSNSDCRYYIDWLTGRSMQCVGVANKATVTSAIAF